MKGSKDVAKPHPISERRIAEAKQKHAEDIAASSIRTTAR